MVTKHLLDGAKLSLLSDQGRMETRRCLVLHFTGGATGASSVDAMRERGVSAHLVVDRDGSVTQCVPFDRCAAHAGRSRWKDPNTGALYSNLNSCSIGIEIANAGNDDGALSWARKQPGFSSIKAKHRNGGPLVEWENYSAAQIAKVMELSKLLVETYNLDDVTGHDCIAPERKDDPGPAFPMEDVRKHCGFSGLPVVHTL